MATFLEIVGLAIGEPLTQENLRQRVRGVVLFLSAYHANNSMSEAGQKAWAAYVLGNPAAASQIEANLLMPFIVQDSSVADDQITDDALKGIVEGVINNHRIPAFTPAQPD